MRVYFKLSLVFVQITNCLTFRFKDRVTEEVIELSTKWLQLSLVKTVIAEAVCGF